MWGEFLENCFFVCEVILRVVNDIYVQDIDLKRGENALEYRENMCFKNLRIFYCTSIYVLFDMKFYYVFGCFYILEKTRNSCSLFS